MSSVQNNHWPGVVPECQSDILSLCRVIQRLYVSWGRDWQYYTKVLWGATQHRLSLPSLAVQTGDTDIPSTWVEPDMLWVGYMWVGSLCTTFPHCEMQLLYNQGTYYTWNSTRKFPQGYQGEPDTDSPGQEVHVLCAFIYTYEHTSACKHTHMYKYTNMQPCAQLPWNENGLLAVSF